MKMEIKNFSGISNAVIEYNGFTIVTGTNSTGKSTLGKTLNFIFKEFKNTNQKYIEYLYFSLNRRIEEFFAMDNTLFAKSLSEADEFLQYLRYDAIPKLVNAREVGDVEEEILIINTVKAKCYDITIEIADDENELNVITGNLVRFPEVGFYKRFIDILNMSKNEALHNLLRSNIRQYFDLPYNKSTRDELFVELKIKNDSTIVKSDFNSQLYDIENYVDIKNNVFYIDDDVLSVLDDIIYSLDREKSDYKNLWYRTRNKFLNDVIKIKNELELESDIERAAYRADTDEIRKKINAVYSSALLFDNDDEISTSSNDIAVGFKLFILLDKLLEHGIFTEKDVVILDEPEIHIHPSLQVDLAQMLYELREALDLTMVVNTHSPFFIEALTTITDLRDKNPKMTTRLYTMSGHSGNFVSTDVTDNPSKIFDEMAEAYKKIDNLKAVFYKNED